MRPLASAARFGIAVFVMSGCQALLVFDENAGSDRNGGATSDAATEADGNSISPDGAAARDGAAIVSDGAGARNVFPAGTTSFACPTSDGNFFCDAFNRRVSGSWGMAPDTESWSNIPAQGSQISVEGAELDTTVSGFPSNDGAWAMALIGDGAATDIEVFGVVVRSDPSATGGLVVRSNASGTTFVAAVTATQFSIQRLANGLPNAVSGGVPIASGVQRFGIRVRVVGNAFSARAWPWDTSEPAGWPVTWNESDSQTPASGRFGVGAVGGQFTTQIIEAFAVK